ncbi:sensor histidine kinase [Paenibacillus sp. NPDC056579]|uniref:sensor histidine kinase n=1 Tax=Paenibacillus sp. NPDC056579 TaxID=3345871 RepID=UPI0036902A2D
MKEYRFILLLIIIVIPLAGELKFRPFYDDFRFSLGPPVFFFFLLWMRRPSPWIPGFLAGLSVVVFRIALDWMWEESFDWYASLQHHGPVFFYYVTYAATFALTQIHKFKSRPIQVGLLGVVLEMAASCTELFFRYSLTDRLITLTILNQILIIAFFRSFVVVGFINLLELRQSQASEALQRQRNEEMLLLISHLHEESIHLKKTLQNAESITRESYELYQSLKNHHPPLDGSYAQKALSIAGQVHEIKKDNQRIYAGLSDLMTDETLSDYMPMEALAELIVATNRKYARSLGKDIQFGLHMQGRYPPCHVYTTLSLLNNLVANAVEAIDSAGQIDLFVYPAKDGVGFRIEDSGPGIPMKARELVFKPGYTTKYDASGNPSTGIGLYYVKEAVEQLGGTIDLRTGEDDRGTIFTLHIPIHSLTKEAD